MPPRLNLFSDRRRANSFGAAATDYDTHRPRYPEALMDDTVPAGATRALEVGAGTGIASAQLIERGADLLAVEPDPRMAALARAKGVAVELGTFEEWEPAGRRFDRVVFAASFHWVDPAVALPKVRAILDDGGVLALIWNRLRPTNPNRADFDAIYSEYREVEKPRDEHDAEQVVDMITAAGFDVAQRRYPHNLHYSAQQWVDIAFTFSQQLLVPADRADELRTRLIERIGPAGVSVGGDAVALFATPV